MLDLTQADKERIANNITKSIKEDILKAIEHCPEWDGRHIAEYVYLKARENRPDKKHIRREVLNDYRVNPI